MNLPSPSSRPARQVKLVWRRNLRQSFTLIELLIVMSIIIVVTSLVLPAMRGPVDAISLSGAYGMTESILSVARQAAITRNLPVEVRIYKNDDGTGNEYRVLGSVIPASKSGVTPAVNEWISPPKALPGHIIMVTDPTFSTLLAKTPGGPDPKDTTSYKSQQYISLTFQANGSTDLPETKADGVSPNPWCLSLKNPHSPAVTGPPPKPAANYVAIVIDAATGRTMSYQP